MKRGAKRTKLPDAKRVRKGNLFETLPLEMEELILSKIPAVFFLGKNSISKVCKTWHEISQGEYFKQKYSSLNKVLASCQQDPKAAVYALSDEIIFNQLPFDKALTIAGSHPEYFLKLWENEDFKKALSEVELVILGTANAKTAEAILQDEVLKQKLDSTHLVTLGEAYETATFIILREEKFLRDEILSNKLSDYQILSLTAKHHALSLNLWLKMKDAELDAHRIDCLVMLGCAHHDIACEIMVNLYSKLTVDNLQSLGLAHLDIAQYIFHKERKNLPQRCLNTLACVHHDIAVTLFQDQEFKQKVKAIHLSLIGRAHHDIALAILQDETLKEKLGIILAVGLGVAHEDIARTLLRDEGLTLDAESLITLGCAHYSIAQEIIANEVFLQKILQSTTSSCNGLLRIGQAHTRLGLAILHDEAYRSDPDLLELGTNYQLARTILQDEVLKERIDASTLFAFLKMHPSLVHLISQDEGLKNKLLDEYLPEYHRILFVRDFIHNAAKEYNNLLNIDQQSSINSSNVPRNVG